MKRVIFMGSADFSVPALQALSDASYDVALVVTRQDKPKGRGLALSETPVKTLASKLGIQVFQPKTLREPDVLDRLRDVQPELIVVVAYGRILPPEVLSLPPRLPHGQYACVNVHASLLPKYRGAAPIQWAILNGEQETGVTIMLMEEGLDTGPIASQVVIPIQPDDTTGTLSQRLAAIGAELLIKTLPPLISGTLEPKPQDHALATHAPVLHKEDGQIVWRRPANAIVNHIRAMDPWPGAFTWLPRGLRLRVYPPARQLTHTSAGTPGQVIEITKEGMVVTAGDGAVLIQKVQPEGRRPMTPWELVSGRFLMQGDIFISNIGT